MPQAQMELFHYWRSSCSWRVRWALEVKGLSYASTPVNLLKNEHKDPAYLQRNPTGLVPCLTVDGKNLGDSLAIIEWLDETYPEPRLLPQDPWLKAQVREFSMLIAAGIQPICNLRVLHHYSESPTERAAWSQHFMKTGLLPVERRLEKSAGTHCFGDSLSMADLFLIPQIYNALRFEVDLSPLPHCQRIYEACLKTVTCKKAAPENQPGAQ